MLNDASAQLSLDGVQVDQLDGVRRVSLDQFIEYPGRRIGADLLAGK